MEDRTEIEMCVHRARSELSLLRVFISHIRELESPMKIEEAIKRWGDECVSAIDRLNAELTMINKSVHIGSGKGKEREKLERKT